MEAYCSFKSIVGGISALIRETESKTLKLFIQLITFNPRADGAKCRARVLIPPGYLHPGKGKH
jgi:hypothetical protein